MSLLLIVALALTLAIAAAHSFLGEKYILGRLFRRDDLPRLFGSDTFTKRTLRFAWHLTSVAWVGLGLVMVALAGPPGAATRSLALRFVALTFLVTAVLALAGSRGRHLSWPVFLAIAVLAWFAAG